MNKQILVAFLLCAMSAAGFADVLSNGTVTTTYHFTVYQHMFPNVQNSYQIHFPQHPSLATCNGQVVSSKGSTSVTVAPNAPLSCIVTTTGNGIALPSITDLTATYPVGTHCFETIQAAVMPDQTINPTVSSNTNYGEATITAAGGNPSFSNDANVSLDIQTGGRCKN